MEKCIQIELNNNYIAEKFLAWLPQSTTTPNFQPKEQVRPLYILLSFPILFIILELADMEFF